MSRGQKHLQHSMYAFVCGASSTIIVIMVALAARRQQQNRFDLSEELQQKYLAVIEAKKSRMTGARECKISFLQI